MRFLLSGTLTAAVTEALVRHGHKVDALPADSATGTGVELLKLAHKSQLDVLTNDPELANAPFQAEPFLFARSLVFLQLEGEDVEQDDAIDRLFARYKSLTPGRLYTVTETRVKVRQLPHLK